MKTYLVPEEVTLIESMTSNLRDRLLIRLLFRMGCRISEALALNAEDVDFKQGTITIQHLKQRLNLSCPKCGTRLGKNHTYCPRCGNEVAETVKKYEEHRKVRTLPVDSSTLDMLSEFIKRDKTEGLIFRINRHRAWQIIKECAEKANLPKLINPETGRARNISPHRLRDAFAVRAVKFDDSGDGLRMLQEHLGHASFNTTAKYRKVSGEEHKEWYRKLWEDQSGT
jgi:integrase/recombinase XerD